MQQPFTGPTYALSSRQTDCREPSRSHGYQFVPMYHVMTSSIHLSSFCCSLYNLRKRVCPRKLRKFAPSENFPLYGIYTSPWRFLEPPLFVCFFLTFCSLRSNQISDEGARAVAAALQVNQSLQELKWVQPFMSYFFSFPLVGR